MPRKVTSRAARGGWLTANHVKLSVTRGRSAGSTRRGSAGGRRRGLSLRRASAPRTQGRLF